MREDHSVTLPSRNTMVLSYSATTVRQKIQDTGNKTRHTRMVKKVRMADTTSVSSSGSC